MTAVRRACACDPRMGPLLLLAWLGTGFASGAEKAGAPLGSADFTPSATRPVGWRGDGTGCFPGATPVTHWHEPGGTDADAAKPAENILWKAAMPGRSSSSPIVVDGKVITLADPHLVLCLDADSGKVLWQREVLFTDTLPSAEARAARALFTEAWDLLLEVGKGAKGMGADIYSVNDKDGVGTPEKRERTKALWRELQQRYQLHLPRWADTGFSTPTPCSDGEHIYVKFTPGTVACLDLEGAVRWIVKLPVDKWDAQSYATSPLLLDGRLVVTFRPKETRGGEGGGVQEDGQVLLALDKRSGAELWRSSPVRLTGSWSGTPVILTVDGTPLLLTAGGAVIHPRDGQVLLEDTGMSASGCSPVAVGNRGYFQHGGGNDVDAFLSVTYAIGDDGKLAATEQFMAKISNGRYFGSPLVTDDLVFTRCSTNGRLEILDAKTGTSLASPRGSEWSHMGDWSYPSVTRAGNLVHVPGKTKTTVVKPSSPPQVAAVNAISERTCSSPFFQGGRMYLRSVDSLYCIGKR